MLAHFDVQVRGMRLYEVRRGECVVGATVNLRRDPGNPYDPNCVEVYQGGLKLGHIARQAAKWVSELLASYRLTG